MFFIKFLAYAGSLTYVWAPKYHRLNDFPQLKNFIVWMLPILVVFLIWIIYLEILRKSCVGIYVFMLWKIICGFVKIAFIWIPTLFAFSFLFQMLMHNSGKGAWIKMNNNGTNSINETDITNNTSSDNSTSDWYIIFNAMVKTSSMMIGDLGADDILESQNGTLSFLLLLFEVVGTILLLNLVISVAVGDVDELRKTSEDELLKEKLDFVIVVLLLLESPRKICKKIVQKCCKDKIYRRIASGKGRTNNKLMIYKDGGCHSECEKYKAAYFPKFEPGNEPRPVTLTNSGNNNDGNNSSTSSVQIISTQSHDIIIINLSRDQGSVSPGKKTI
ncbi:hypothetical protein WR25_02742 isoform X [Diploscapter pachys]|uniref:Ion transport domain-containing protein n=2 Tax=Diploscapter pachys TaxID=2018661 RepID=A0A2A2L212_9BILA|nr:hypothetical protein WR25_02742 isoform N [Diploscapter pachys]PAV80301.1 hypothetical protein WR25_02742 isoform X [Diploscapter pachys]